LEIKEEGRIEKNALVCYFKVLTCPLNPYIIEKIEEK
jgi:hypothetical protein